MSIPFANVAKVVQILEQTGLKRATKYVSPKHTIKATRMHKDKSTYVVTLGKPNFRERLFIKTLLSAEEPFPVRQIQLR